MGGLAPQFDSGTSYYVQYIAVAITWMLNSNVGLGNHVMFPSPISNNKRGCDVLSDAANLWMPKTREVNNLAIFIYLPPGQPRLVMADGRRWFSGAPLVKQRQEPPLSTLAPAGVRRSKPPIARWLPLNSPSRLRVTAHSSAFSPTIKCIAHFSRYTSRPSYLLRLRFYSKWKVPPLV